MRKTTSIVTLLALATACPQVVTDSAEECVPHFFDDDGDGYGNPASTSVCLTAAIDGYVPNADDCDDTDKTVGAAEVCDVLECARPNADPELSDCDGDGWPSEFDCDDYNGDYTNDCPWIDRDGDGFLSPADCDDTKAAVNPLATETCNGLDDNCDGKVDEGLAVKTWYRDADGDGFGNDADKKEACAAPAGYVEKGGDCNDADATKTTECPVVATDDGKVEICLDFDSLRAKGATQVQGFWLVAKEGIDLTKSYTPTSPEILDSSGWYKSGYWGWGDGFISSTDPDLCIQVSAKDADVLVAQAFVLLPASVAGGDRRDPNNPGPYWHHLVETSGESHGRVYVKGGSQTCKVDGFLFSESSDYAAHKIAQVCTKPKPS